ncbi:hypothetical protein VPHPS32B4_0038 [Vibrio phage PS32B-4]
MECIELLIRNQLVGRSNRRNPECPNIRITNIRIAHILLCNIRLLVVRMTSADAVSLLIIRKVKWTLSLL